MLLLSHVLYPDQIATAVTRPPRFAQTVGEERFDATRAIIVLPMREFFASFVSS